MYIQNSIRKEYDHFRAMAQLFYASNRTADSYFWEARRLLGGADTLSPRQAFIQAVAGQPPRGYERVVLERGEAPAAVCHRRADGGSRPSGTPSAASGSTHPYRPHTHYPVPRRAASGSWRRRTAQTSPGSGRIRLGPGADHRRDTRKGTPCSDLVAQLVSGIDGHTSVAELLAILCADREAAQRAQIATSVLAALQILYVDGTVADLVGL